MHSKNNNDIISNNNNIKKLKQKLAYINAYIKEINKRLQEFNLNRYNNSYFIPGIDDTSNKDTLR